MIVETAKNGIEAVRLAKEIHYAAIIMDMQIPQLNGTEATRQIREIPDYRRTQILAMTANALPEDRTRCFEAGMNYLIIKPIEPDEVFATLRRFLEPESVLSVKTSWNSTCTVDRKGLERSLSKSSIKIDS